MAIAIASPAQGRRISSVMASTLLSASIRSPATAASKCAMVSSSLLHPTRVAAGVGVGAGGTATIRQYHHYSLPPPLEFVSSPSLRRPAPTAIPIPATRRHYSLDRPNSSFSPLSLFSPPRLGGGGSNDSSPYGQSLEISSWPITKTNTILNIVPQGKRMVVERFGKLHSIHESGYFFAIPLVDSIAYVIDVRERAVDILPQSAITRDNVSVEVSGNLFVRVSDPERAAYGSRNPLHAVIMHAQSAMRSAIGELELDEILHNRSGLNTLIKGSIQEASVAWGLEVRRYELTEITPDQQIRVAMDKQAAAERDRREQVLRAEGAKRRAELESEGIKISMKNQSEGELIKVTNEAEAEKLRILREAEGRAEALMIQAEAQAQAIGKIASRLSQSGGQEAAALDLAREYVKMYGEMGSKSNTIFFNEGGAPAGNLQSLLVQAMTSMKAMEKGVGGGRGDSGSSGGEGNDVIVGGTTKTS